MNMKGRDILVIYMYQNTDLASTQLKDWNICNFISFKVSCSGGTGHNFE